MEPIREIENQMQNEFRKATFETWVNSEFQIMENGSPVCALQLTGIVQRTKTPTQETFSLMFRGPLTPFLPQGIRSLKHGELGELDIFLVPVEKEKDGFEYEAVFNLLLPSS
jgi:hypothetical protein